MVAGRGVAPISCSPLASGPGCVLYAGMIRCFLIPAIALLSALSATADAIPFAEAAKHVGAEVTVTGKVSAVRVIPSGMGFVNFGGRVFTAIAKPGTFEAGKLEEFMGKDVEVTGTVELYKGSPQIVLKDAASIRIPGGAPAAQEGDAPKPKAAEDFTIQAEEIELNRNEIRAAGKTAGGFSPTNTKIAIALPNGFKPAPDQRILAVFPDFSGEADLEKLTGYYAGAATARGWVVISAHSATKENSMPPGWYAAMTGAAIRHLATDFPGAETWPIYVAGSSEGASRASLSFGALMNQGYDVRGCFLNSFKREEFRKSIREFDPSKSKLKRLKVFISHGEQDNFVTKAQSEEQAEAIREAEAGTVRYELHPGKGWVDAAILGTALEWFEEGNP